MDDRDVEHFVTLLREIAKLLDDISKKLDRIDNNMTNSGPKFIGVG